MSVNGLQQPYVNNSLDGLVYVEVDGLTINGIPVDPTTFIPYTGATKPVSLGPFSLETLTSLSARQHNFTTFTSTIMTSPTTSSLFTADAWHLNNTIQISSLGGGAFLSTSYLHIRDHTNSSTLLTLQSDGIADFGHSIPRASTLAMSNYDLVNLSTLSNAVAYLEGITSLNFVPYVGSLSDLDMGGSTITTTGLMSAGAVRVTSSVSNTDYSLSVNGSNFLEFTNLLTSHKIYTDGASLWLPSNLYGSGIVYSVDLQLSGTSYLAYGTIYQYGTSVNGSGKYEIADDTGNGILTLSKTTGLTVSTLTISQVPSASPTYCLGINGGGSVVSFAVPTATNILPLANTFTNTNTFLSTLTTAVGYTTSINGALSTTLNDLGFTSASFTTAGITGAYTPPLGSITNPSGSTYQITQTAQGRSIMAISGFTPSVGITYVFSFNIKCTVGTATISVEQDNILVSPALYQLTTGFNRVVGSFTYNGTPNTVVFKIYTGVASWNAQWDSFVLSTYSIGMNADMNALTVSNRFTQRYNALAGDVSTLVNRATMDSAISAIPLPPNLLPLSNVWTGTNTFNNTVQVSGVGVNLGVSLGSIIKTTATAGSFVQITGGGATNSPYLEFFFGGNSRGYLGNASAVDLDLVAQNGAKLNFYTAGAKRMVIDTAGNVGIGRGDPGYKLDVNGAMRIKNDANLNDCKTIYGPNASWSAFLTVGSGTDSSGPATAQVLSTDGNLHLDAGNNNSLYYGFYPNSRGTPNSHRWFGTNYTFDTIPQNDWPYSHTLTYRFDTGRMMRSQCMMKQVYKVDYISWGPGINIANAIYKYNALSPVRISGKYSGYCTFVGMPTMTMRIYSQSSGATRYYSFPTYQNITYSQTTYPIDLILNSAELPELGYFDIYIYNSYGMSTDINNQLWVNVQLLPVSEY